MFERRLTRASVLAVHRSVEEAAARGAARIGTEHLLLGLLHDPLSGPAQALGSSAADVRSALETLDLEALRAVGVEARPLPPAAAVRSRGHRPFTSAARSVLERAVVDRASKRRRVEPNHLLAALLDGRRPDPALDVLERLGVDRAVVLGRIARGEAGAA